MIVQEADRFGLAQLHQLRGRVGRGAEQSYCLLVSRHPDELSETAIERLEAMVATTDGFELAERDLEIRGEGQLVGARQSGLTDLRFTRLRADRDLLERAKELADAGAGEELLADGRRPPPRRRRARRRVLSPRRARRIVPRCGSSPARTGAAGSRRRRASRRARPATASARRSSTSSAPSTTRRCSTSIAGSGALGLEALSRGARRCVFAETDPAACRVIRQNLESLGLTGALVLQRDAVSVLREERTAGTTARADPPRPALRGVGARSSPCSRTSCPTS